MCCFSRPVDFVSNTEIFARPTGKGRQLLIYSMRVGAKEALAMILPIPVAEGTPENAVEFIDLKGYPNLFDDLTKGFPPPPRSPALAAESFAAPKSAPKLKVENVGNFVASFVPTVADFKRLDDRFRLPTGAWKRLGQYDKFGFAVFQLKPGEGQVHPMAFTFPTATPEQLFFPTVHIHDGEVHPKADFDHKLYCQAPKQGLKSLLSWEESGLPAAKFIDTAKASGVIDLDRHVYRHGLHGNLANVDTVLRVA
jgi:hypothetical protein